METKTDWNEFSRNFFERAEKQLAEIKDSIKHVLTEQERQRIKNMTYEEMLREIQSNSREIRATLDALLFEKVGDETWSIH